MVLYPQDLNPWLGTPGMLSGLDREPEVCVCKTGGVVTERPRPARPR